MTALQTDDLLRRYLLGGIENNRNQNHVGIELEYPLLHGRGKRVRPDVLVELFRRIADIGFDKQTFSSQGLPIRARDERGNVLTFDTCYDNLEYVAAHNPSMLPMYHRWREALCVTQACLMEHDHALCGMGRHPYPFVGNTRQVEVDLTRAIRQFLENETNRASRSQHLDFYEFISSEQVHFNTTAENLPRLLHVLTSLDFVNVLLFADSPMTIGGHSYLCGRNELYCSSEFYKMGLAGAQSLSARTMDDLVDEYRKACMFQRHRDGRAEVFPPVPFETYFSDPAYGAREEDIRDFDMARNAITTSYGTVEYRPICSQPFGQAFTPSAFNVGLIACIEDTQALCDAFYAQYDLYDENILVRQAAQNGHLRQIPEAQTDALLAQLLEISKRGLIKRGYGEEAFLAPLENRARLRDNPASVFLADPDGFDKAVDKRKKLSEPLV